MSAFRIQLDPVWASFRRKTLLGVALDPSDGFALLEALIAVTILGTGIVVVLGALTSSARLQQTSEERLLAIQILEEKLILVDLDEELTPGSSSGSVDLGNRQFKWQMDILGLGNSSSIADSNGFLLEVKVVVEWPSWPKPRTVTGSCLLWKEPL